MIDLKALAEQIKSSVPLADVMEAVGVKFTSRGGDAWKTTCFMHADPNPSLVVSPSKNLWNCFSTGCTGRGDVISFYQAWHNIDFTEAVKKLGVEWALVGEEEIGGFAGDANKARLLKITFGVIKELNSFLLKDKMAAHIRAHMKKRGVSAETIGVFQVGYSPSTKFTTAVARKLGATNKDIDALEFDKNLLFGGKIVLPVACPRRTAIFYYATSIDRKSGPKYAGSVAANPLRWSGAVFGLHEARNHVRQAKTLILVEGFFDALALHSHGIKNVVGCLGSNPSVDQFATLKSYSIPSVTVLFDGDKGGDAGIHAVIKNASGMRTHVAFVPEGDPDDYVINYGRQALDSVIEQGISPIDFLVNEAASDFEEGTVYTKSDRLGKLLSAVKAMPPHESAIAIAEVARLSNIPTDIVHDLLNTIDTTLENPTESEKIVLAGAMQDPTYFNSAELRIGNRTVWSVQKHRIIWDAMVVARKKDATVMTPELIAVEASAKADVEAILADFETLPVSNYDYHLNLVCDAAVRRGLQSASKQLFGDSANKGKPLQDIVAKHMTALAIASTTRTQNEFTAKEQVKTAMDYLHDQMANEGKMPGLDLGHNWRSFMEATLGLRPSCTYILSALPKTGKSMVAMNWNLELAVAQNIPTLWLNGEMNERDLALRNIAILSGVSGMRLQRGAITAKEKELVDVAAAKYYASPLRVVNSAGMSVHDAINAMRKAVYSDGVRCVFLDYIQLLRGTSTLSYWERHMEISTELKAAVSRLPVPLVAISQQSKSSMEGGGGANQGGSFKYVQDADAVLDLRRRTDQEMAEGGGGNLRLSIDYNRHGPQDVFADLMFNTDNLQISEV